MSIEKKLAKLPREAQHRAKAKMAATAAAAVADDPKAGPVGVMLVEVGNRTVAVSDPHVDELGRFGVTITHPDLPEWCDTPFYFNNPPVRVRTPDAEVPVEDPAAAVVEMVRGVLAVVWADA